MKLFQTLKPFIFAFAIAMVIYLVAYNVIEHRRTHQGPWQAVFTNISTVPALIINEPGLKIANFQIDFPGEKNTNQPVTLIFGEPQPVPFAVPFGKCVFEDTTFQPGTVVFQLFGHEIQLLPRVLTIDKKEYSWTAANEIPLSKADISRAVP